MANEMSGKTIVVTGAGQGEQNKIHIDNKETNWSDDWTFGTALSLNLCLITLFEIDKRKFDNSVTSRTFYVLISFAKFFANDRFHISSVEASSGLSHQTENSEFLW